MSHVHVRHVTYLRHLPKVEIYIYRVLKRVIDKSTDKVTVRF